MKKELRFLIWAHLVVILFLLYQVSDLITLIYDDTFQDSLSSVDLNPPEGGHLNRPELIPKIIHQTYKNSTIPEKWKEGQQACIDLHPDYQYILWTDTMAREFISDHYPWFLKTFDNYKYPIQRADSIRYFVLNHYGGIYIDLDDGCQRKLDPLLTVPAFVRKTAPSGISNDVMGSVPRHPFFQKVLDSLEKYNHNYLVPYITVMYTTGPLFLSVIWKRYKRWGVPEGGVVRILQPDDYKRHSYSFFKIVKGDSWHLNDAQFIKSLAHHIVECVIAGFVLAFAVFYLEWKLYKWLQNGNYVKIRNQIYRTLHLKIADDDLPYYVVNNNDGEPNVHRQTSAGQSGTYSASNGMLKLVGLQSNILDQFTGKKINRNRKDSNIILPNVDIELNFTDE